MTHFVPTIIMNTKSGNRRIASKGANGSLSRSVSKRIENVIDEAVAIPTVKALAQKMKDPKNPVWILMLVFSRHLIAKQVDWKPATLAKMMNAQLCSAVAPFKMNSPLQLSSTEISVVKKPIKDGLRYLLARALLFLQNARES